MSTTIKDVMTPNPSTIGDDQLVAQARHEMRTRGIRHLPVLHGGRCVGIVSDRDLKLACDMDTRQGESLKISDVCSPDVYTVTSSESVKSVAAHMAEMGIGSAVIVDDREKVIGIFTVTDACRLLAESL